MEKILTLLIISVLCCLVFTSCGKTEEQEQSTSETSEVQTTVEETELSAYEKMTDREKDFADVMLKSLQYFNNPKSVSVTYAYYNSGTDTWAITVSAQNQMGGQTETDYDLQRNGKITKPIYDHIKTGLDSHFDLNLINEYISDYANR